MVRGRISSASAPTSRSGRRCRRPTCVRPGQFTFNGTITGLPLADFLTGSLSQLIQATPNSLDMQQLYLGLYAQDTWKLSPKATLNYGVRWEPGLAQQIRNGAIYNFSVDRFRAGTRPRSTRTRRPDSCIRATPDFTNDKAGMENHWWQFSPRVGFAWDPNGDGRMSVRTGYSLSYDFVNAQFHLNTSVAPPFNAEARVDNPAGGFDNPWLGTGNETFFPFTTGPNSRFPLTGPYISIPSDIRCPAPAVVERQPAAPDRRQPGRVSDLSGQLFGPPVERALAESGRLHPGLVHAADADGTADVHPLLDQRDAQQPPRADDAELRDRQVSGRRGRAHRARLPEVQRLAAERAAAQRRTASPRVPTTRCRSAWACRPRAARRRTSAPGTSIPPIPTTTTARATPTGATCST